VEISKGLLSLDVNWEFGYLFYRFGWEKGTQKMLMFVCLFFSFACLLACFVAKSLSTIPHFARQSKYSIDLKNPKITKQI